MDKLLGLVEECQNLKRKINFQISNSRNDIHIKKYQTELLVNKDISDFIYRTIEICNDTGFKLIALKITNITNIDVEGEIQVRDFSEANHILTEINKFLLDETEKIENRVDKKKIEIISVEDIDQFKPLLEKSTVVDVKYFNSFFYEWKIKREFLKIFDEPYSQGDSPAEMCDMYTDNLKVNGKRLHSIIMLKGKSIKTELQISDCGINGDQLLKMSKNFIGKLYIVQHVNAISQNVKDALVDHLEVHSKDREVKVCFIDGQDTAKILSGFGCDLEEMGRLK
ncbi:hypothetical protein QWY31_09490 [Cytophagales bacterium LB-30]|uniref:Uncharacterized protein n=1 Tax=Shiella aurantiaca TaxID=3058365 RepID=A0ABT8F5K9_9BACT|nr:hypothetical protein [Shiella aurantiaca]MDN4165735.1 hypothetical protein [Shiella aurantiaca]